MTERVAIYVRVSTGDQSTEMQESDLNAYSDARGWRIIQIYQESASGRDENRPILKSLMADAKQRKFDIVCVWRLDRFARSLKHLVTCLQDFQDLGVQFVSLKDNIDLTTATGRLMTHILAAFSEFEAAIIRERVQAGVNAARSKGKRLGRPPSLDHYHIDFLRRKGLSLSAIAREVGCSRSAVSKSLSQTHSKNPVQKTEITDDPDSS